MRALIPYIVMICWCGILVLANCWEDDEACQPDETVNAETHRE